MQWLKAFVEWVPTGSKVGLNEVPAARVGDHDEFSSGLVSAEYRLNIPESRKKHEKLYKIPFNSTNKWQVSVPTLPQDILLENEEKMQVDGRRALVQMKGAPERILVLCNRYMRDGEMAALDEEKRDEILEGVMSLGGRGERVLVLVLAELLLDAQHYDITCQEPIVDASYPRETDESCAGNEVEVVFEGERHKIAVDAVDDNGEAVAFADAFVTHLMDAIEAAMEGKPKAAQRLVFADKGGPLDAAISRKELGIEAGCVVTAQQGDHPVTAKANAQKTISIFISSIIDL